MQTASLEKLLLQPRQQKEQNGGGMQVNVGSPHFTLIPVLSAEWRQQLQGTYISWMKSLPFETLLH